MNKKINIVGAGLSGLVAGINLVREGYKVKVYEARKNIGGDTSYLDSTFLSPRAIKAESGIEIEEALEPWTDTTVWAYGKKNILPNPVGVEAFTIERGKRSSSLENVIYRQAVNSGVEVETGKRLSNKEINDLPPNSIIATGLTKDSFEMLDIPCSPFYCHIAHGSTKSSDRKLIVYFDKFTNEFGYYYQARGITGGLVFSLQRPLENWEVKAFTEKLSRNDGIEFNNWNDSFSSWAAWPLGRWKNRSLFHGNKILTGTLSGVISPVLLYGVNGALVSGKIAALAVKDKNLAHDEFKKMHPLYYSQMAFRRFRENAPHFLIKPLIKLVMNTYHPKYFTRLINIAWWPPGFEIKK